MSNTVRSRKGESTSEPGPNAPKSKKFLIFPISVLSTVSNPNTLDTPFYQQTMKAWQPIMSPTMVVAIFIIIGVAFVPTGVTLMNQADAIYEDSITYDNGKANSQCPINSGACVLNFILAQDISSDLHVYYQLTNYYQNHRVYVASRSADQLGGLEVTEAAATKACATKVVNNASQLLNPCGLIANSYFTDSINFQSTSKLMKETGISWASDKMKFFQPSGFKSSPVDCAVAASSTSCTSVGLPSNCKKYAESSTSCYLFFYPNDDKIQYLYESYPSISPIKGVTDEHFMVWMRTAALPTFRKLYGTIPGPFKKGDSLPFVIFPTYEVKSFGGTKSLIISTVGQFGGKNIYLGAGYVIVGGLSLLLAFMFVIKGMLSGRKPGDRNLLTWGSP